MKLSGIGWHASSSAIGCRTNLASAIGRDHCANKRQTSQRTLSSFARGPDRYAVGMAANLAAAVHGALVASTENSDIHVGQATQRDAETFQIVSSLAIPNLCALAIALALFFLTLSPGRNRRTSLISEATCDEWGPRIRLIVTLPYQVSPPHRLRAAQIAAAENFKLAATTSIGSSGHYEADIDHGVVRYRATAVLSSTRQQFVAAAVKNLLDAVRSTGPILTQLDSLTAATL